MEKSSKRGKIPQSDWPLIMARYEAGETLASIARTYDCSPPAISYVVSRSRARQPGAALPNPAPSVTEPQLIKVPAAAETATGVAKSPSIAASPVAAPPPTSPFNPAPPAMAQMRRDDQPTRLEPAAPAAADRREEMQPREINGFSPNDANGRDANSPVLMPRTAPPPHRPPGLPMNPQTSPAFGNGDSRRTLHLSLGSGPNANTPQGNTAAAANESQPNERHNFAPYHQQPQPQPVAAPSATAEIAPAVNYPPARSGTGDARSRKDAGTFIDSELRARVDADIAAFLAAFDAALAQDTQESRSSLREATDRLLRVGARTRIELERLEARVPLPPRDNDRRGEPAWRQR